jgi:hypothetical protein
MEGQCGRGGWRGGRGRRPGRDVWPAWGQVGVAVHAGETSSGETEHCPWVRVSC